MSQETPRVSIGMPVFNEARFLRESLDSLLNQEYRDFELIISDNASTDETGQICEEYASRDSRIRYFRNEKNLGMTLNFFEGFKRARGDYFMMAAGHDLRNRDYLRRCVEVLDHHPEVILAYGRTDACDLDGNFVCVIPVYAETRGLSASERLRKVIRNTGSCFLMYGVIRIDPLRQSSILIESYGADTIVIAELSLQGEFWHIPETALVARMPEDRKLTDEENTARLISAERAHQKSGIFMTKYPHAQLMLQLLRIVRQSNLSSMQKISLAFDIIGWLKIAVLKEFTVKQIPEGIRNVFKRAVTHAD